MLRFLQRIFRRQKGISQEKLSELVDFKSLEKIIGYNIKNYKLFVQALSHQSYLHSTDKNDLSSYERLEFLGDSILNFVVTEHLFQNNKSAKEGDLTKIRSRLVSRKALVAYARQIHLENFLLIRDQSQHTISRGIEKILADAFEAIIAAIYLDAGYSQVKTFLENQIHLALQTGAVSLIDENFKSQLLEYTQAQGLGIPKYVTILDEGPDHDRTFTIEVLVNGKPCGRGTGKTKKDAEQAAAEQAIQKILF